MTNPFMDLPDEPGATASSANPFMSLPNEVPQDLGVLPSDGSSLFSAVAEPIVSMATGTAASAAGGLRGLYDVTLGGKTADEASQRIQDIQQKYTYQPRTSWGKNVNEAIAAPFELGSERLGQVGGVIGGAFDSELGGEAIGKAALPTAMTLLGGRAALKAAPTGTAAAQDWFNRVKQEQASRGASTDVEFAQQHAGAIRAAQHAQDLPVPIAVNPVNVTPSAKSRGIAHAAGYENLNRALAKDNEPKWTANAKIDLGISEGEALTPQAYNAALESLAAPKNAIKQLPSMVDDGTALADIERLRPPRVPGQKAREGAIDRVLDDAIGMISTGMDGSMVMNAIEQLRNVSRDLYKRSELSVIERAEAEASRGVANVLEGLVERNISDPALLKAYVDNRKQMAKVYAYKDATDFTTNRIDPTKLAKMVNEGEPLTGIARQMGELAGAMPEVARSTSSLQQLAPAHLYRSGIGGSLGYIAANMVGMPGYIGAGIGAALGEVAGSGLSRYARSKGFQERMQPGTLPVEYVNMSRVQEPPPPGLPTLPGAPPLVPGSWAQGISDRLSGLTGKEPLPVLPFAEGGYRGGIPQEAPPIPQVPRTTAPLPRLPEEGVPVMPETMARTPQLGGVEPIPPNPLLGYGEPSYQGRPAPLPDLPPITRGLLSIAEDLPKGTKTLYEGAIDFMTRQDALSQPAMFEATTQFISKAEELKANIRNSQGFWRNRYQAELDALSKEFANGMLQFGIRNSQEAIGLQQMYQGSGPEYTGTPVPTRLQVEKSKPLRDLMK